MSNLINASQLLAMSDVDRCELISGEISHLPMVCLEHGEVTGELGFRIKGYVDLNRLGKVYAAGTGFIIARSPDTVRAPDVGFVGKQRVPAQPRRGFFEGPPDLAVEVISPDDRTTEVRAKVEQWLTSGTVSVCVVDPPSRSIEVYRANKVRLYRADDEVRDEPTLPGFSLRVIDVFEAD